MKQLPDRTKMLLAVLLLFVLIGAWQGLKPVFFPPGGSTVGAKEKAGRRPSRRSRRGRSSNKVAALPTEVKELDLELLDPKGTRFRVGRNLWAYYTPPPPPRVAPKPQRQPVVITDPVPREPPPPVKPKPPRVPYKFVGTFGSKDRRIAVLSEGKDVLNVLEGEVLKKKFRVALIGYETVTIEYVDFPDAKPAQLEVGG